MVLVENAILTNNLQVGNQPEGSSTAQPIAMIKFNMSRGWGVYQGGSGAGTTLDFIPNSDNKACRFVDFGGTERVKITLANTPANGNLLGLNSTTGGLKLSVLTTAERDAITSPSTGLLIYNSTTGKLNIRVAAAWEAVTSV